MPKRDSSSMGFSVFNLSRRDVEGLVPPCIDLVEGLTDGLPNRVFEIHKAIISCGEVEAKETPQELREVIDRMKTMADKRKNFGFGSLEEMNAFLEALPNKVSKKTLEAIKALKPRESEQDNSFTVFMKIDGKIYLGETAPSSNGAKGEQQEGVLITATEEGKAKRINKGWKCSQTGSAEALFRQLDPAGELNFIRASKGILSFLRKHNLYGEVAWEWLSDPADSGSVWGGSAHDTNPDGSDAYAASGSRGVRALRDVTGECS